MVALQMRQSLCLHYLIVYMHSLVRSMPLLEA